MLKAAVVFFLSSIMGFPTIPAPRLIGTRCGARWKLSTLDNGPTVVSYTSFIRNFFFFLQNCEMAK